MGVNIFALELSLLLLISGYVLYHVSSSPRKVNLPPGPGVINTSSMPLWKRLHEFHARYGPVVSVQLGKETIVSLSTLETAKDLLDKRGNIYSTRPKNIMADILTGGLRVASMPYGTRWKNYRSLLQTGIGVAAANNYRVLQSYESSILLQDLLEENRGHEMQNIHLTRFTSSVSNCISYGKRVRDMNDPMLLAQLEVDRSFVKYRQPGRYIVEFWPILLKLPKFLQWFRWAPEAQRKSDTELLLACMAEVREQMKSGNVHPSVAKLAIEKQAEFGLNDVETAYAVSAPFTAGIATTNAVIQVTLMAMLHYPDAMKKAQAEIDNVVGSDRLPEFEDMSSLPYVDALIREAMRWRPVLPLSIPHAITADDTYGSMDIPKGSTVISNVYTISKDEQIFPSPDVFSPERYLTPGPHSNFYFGFGRRICPGLYVATNSLHIVISRLLWAFDVLPSLDKQGKPILPSTEDFIPSLVIRPVEFPYTLKLRSERKSSVILENAKEARSLADAQWL